MHPRLTPSLLSLIEADALKHPNHYLVVPSDALLSLVAAARELDRVRGMQVEGHAGKISFTKSFSAGKFEGTLGTVMDACTKLQNPAQAAPEPVAWENMTPEQHLSIVKTLDTFKIDVNAPQIKCGQGSIPEQSS